LRSVATAWAALVSLGEEGYLKAAQNIQDTFDVLVSGYLPSSRM
jgi:glutamate/tyrosine decarboxylase-like PLP-dependent enzyme